MSGKSELLIYILLALLAVALVVDVNTPRDQTAWMIEQGHMVPLNYSEYLPRNQS